MTDISYKTTLGVLIVIASFTCHISYAQEQSGADTSNKQAQTETQKADTRQPAAEPSTNSDSAQQQKDKPRGGEIFRPSEEISEDFAVSFPVDI